MYPEVSIIIPTYNRADLIGSSLESLLLQTFGNWECIVIDDGSYDYTEELMSFYLQKDSRIQFRKREILPKGAAHCRNIGLSFALGKFVIFLDSDDLLMDFTLAKRLEQAKAFPTYHFWVFPMFSDDGSNNLKKIEIPIRESYLEDFLSNKIHWGIMCTFWEIEFLKSLNGFNIYYPRLNDPEIHIRAMLAAKKNFKIFNSNPADSIHRKTLDMLKIEDFSARYYQSQLLFIPDISNILISYNEKLNLPLLIGYLQDYIKFYSENVSRGLNSKLIKIYYKHHIIDLKKCILLIVFYRFIFLLQWILTKSRYFFNQLLKL